MSAARSDAKGGAKKPAAAAPAPATNGHANNNKADAKPAGSTKPPLREKRTDDRPMLKGAAANSNNNKNGAPAAASTRPARDPKRPTTAPVKAEVTKPAPIVQRAVPKQPAVAASVAGMSFADMVRKKQQDADAAKAAALAAAAAPPAEKKAKPAKVAAEVKEDKTEKKNKGEPKEARKEDKKEDKKSPTKAETGVLPAPKPLIEKKEPKGDAKKEPKPARERQSKAVAPPARAPAALDPEAPAVKKEASDDMDDKLNKPDATKDPVVPTQSNQRNAGSASWAPPTAAPRAVAEQSPVKPVVEQRVVPQPVPVAPVQSAPAPVQAAPAPAQAAAPTGTNFQLQADAVALPDYVKTIALKQTRKLRFHQPTEAAQPIQQQQQQQQPQQQQPAPVAQQQVPLHREGAGIPSQQGNPQTVAYAQQQQQSMHREPFNQRREQAGQWTHPQSNRENTYGRSDNYQPRYSAQQTRAPGGYGGSYGQQQQQQPFRPQPSQQQQDPFGFQMFKDSNHGAPGSHRESHTGNPHQQQPIGGQRPSGHTHTSGGWGMETTGSAPL